MADIFISYASPDRPVAELLRRELTHEGWSVWWDDELPGDSLGRVQQQELGAARLVLVLLSPRSAHMDGVLDEARQAAAADV